MSALDDVLETMWAAYGVDPDPVRHAVYARSLSDFTVQEVVRAVNVCVALDARPPSIARMREVVFEDRLSLPDAHEAWEAAIAHVHRKRSTARCISCAGLGTKVPTGRVGDAEEVCSACGGSGEVPVEPRAVLPVAVKRALEFVGGGYALKNTDKPEVVRAQFLKAYDHFRLAELRRENLVSLGVLEPAAELVSLEEVAEL